MRAHLIDAAGVHELPFGRGPLEMLRARTDFYRLDLHGIAEEGIELVGNVYGFHPLAVEDATHCGQRPKVEAYDDYVFLVLYGAAPDQDGLVEIHCF